MLSAEDLLAGSGVTHEVEIPLELLPQDGGGDRQRRVVLRPLTVRDLQRIGKAAQDDDGISAGL
jgi:hypothetical protein